MLSASHAPATVSLIGRRESSVLAEKPRMNMCTLHCLLEGVLYWGPVVVQLALEVPYRPDENQGKASFYASNKERKENFGKR